MRCRMSRSALAAVLAGASAVAMAGISPAPAAQPGSSEDITGKTVYLKAGSQLRYQPNLLARVYTHPKLTLEVTGHGTCKQFFCPVEHNKTALYATRVSLDVQKPGAGPIITDRTLRRGDEGNDVIVIQQALIKQGAKINADGKYGHGTEAAVKDFQKKSKLSADGVVGPQTRKLLAA